jgi:hypothetical protein
MKIITWREVLLFVLTFAAVFTALRLGRSLSAAPGPAIVRIHDPLWSTPMRYQLFAGDTLDVWPTPERPNKTSSRAYFGSPRHRTEPGVTFDRHPR